MGSNVLILTQYDDSHAVAVATALRHKGAEAHLWITSDYPQSDVETVRFSNGERTETLTGVPAPYSQFETVWNRRPAYVIDKAFLDPADHEFAELNCRLFRKSLFDLICADALWVNPHAAVRQLTKLLQASYAQEVGLSLPDTVITNDPKVIRDFLASHSQGVVYKPLTTLPWKDEKTYWMPYTAELSLQDLPGDPVLRAAPGIYQSLVPKAHELRVTIMGKSTFTAKILSQSTQTGRLDWRKSYHELQMEETTLPARIDEKCHELLRRLDLVFGCFDFIATPEGDHVFLEVNQMGQFLFLEHYTELPLLDAFCDFLISQDPVFQWRRVSPRIRYRDIAQEVNEALRQAQDHHIKPPEPVWSEEQDSIFAEPADHRRSTD